MVPSTPIIMGTTLTFTFHSFFFHHLHKLFVFFPAFLVFIVLLLLSFIYLCVVRVFSKSPPETSRDNTQMRCLAISEKNVILTTVEREKSTQDIPMSMIFFFQNGTRTNLIRRPRMAQYGQRGTNGSQQ